MNYSTFGGKYKFSSESYEPKFKQLNVPIMVGYKVVNAENMNFRVSHTLNKPVSPADHSKRKFNAGGVVNLGVDLGLFTADAPYSRGLTKINEGLKKPTGIFNLSVGFLIN